MKNILLISDGKAGHESVSRGMLENLSEYIKFNTINVHIKMKSNFFKPILKFISNHKYLHKFISLGLINFFYHFEPRDINFQKIDLIISTGGKTSFVNILLSKLYNINNIYCSSLRGLKPNLFTYIATLDPNNNFNNALKFDIAPLKTKFDIKKANDFLKTINLEPNQKVWSILIGGPTKEYKFTEYEIATATEIIIQKAQSKNINILLTTSRRTPVSIEKYVENIARKYNNMAHIVLYNKNPQKVMNNYLQLSDIIFVTEDSGSMITESIYAKKPVITVRPELTKQLKIFKLFIENCTKNRYIYSCNIHELENLNIVSMKFNIYDERKNMPNFIKIKDLL